jgi:hypothetical protein
LRSVSVTGILYCGDNQAGSAGRVKVTVPVIFKSHPQCWSCALSDVDCKLKVPCAELVKVPFNWLAI